MDIMDIAIAKALAGGGGGGGSSTNFIVNVSATHDENNNAYILNSVNKTASEIFSAFESGQHIEAVVNLNTHEGVLKYVLPLVYCDPWLSTFIAIMDMLTSQGEVELSVFNLHIWADGHGTSSLEYGYADILS